MVQGTIGQVLGLALAGNAALVDRPLGPFWPDGDLFRFCRSVEFAAEDGTVLAGDPVAWIERARQRAAGLRVRVRERPVEEISARMTVGFVGGGSDWLLETVLRDGTRELMRPDWWVAPRPEGNDKPWVITYHRLAAAIANRIGDAEERPLAAIAADLAGTLPAIAGFAERCGSDFALYFRRAADELDGRAPARGPAPAAPGLLNADADRLFAACHTAWVFGGMGSWNDGAYGRDDADEGDPLSERLFALLEEGLAAAVNSTFPRPG